MFSKCLILFVGLFFSRAQAETCETKVKKALDAGVPYSLLKTLAGKRDQSTGQKIFVVDFDRPSNERRFFAINLANGTTEKFLTSHGSGSGKGERATKFSDRPNSRTSSLGLYKGLAPSTVGEHQHTKLQGLDESNRHALDRGITLQGCSQVSELRGFARPSYGSFCLDPAVYRQLQPDLQGSLMLAGLGDRRSGPEPMDTDICALYGYTNGSSQNGTER